MKRIILTAILIFNVICTFSQSFDYGIGAGINYGGPLNIIKDTSSKGKAYPGVSAGFYFRWKPSLHFHLLTGLDYSRNSVDYSSAYKKDTNIFQEFNHVMIEIPTYYTAYINGRMVYDYFHLPLYAVYQWKNLDIFLGARASWLFHISDTTNVRVLIGEGGFFDDYTSTVNRKNIFRRLEFRMSGGIAYNLPYGLAIELKADRSLMALYKKEYQIDVRGIKTKMYNTFATLSIKWSIASVIK